MASLTRYTNDQHAEAKYYELHFIHVEMYPNFCFKKQCNLSTSWNHTGFKVKCLTANVVLHSTKYSYFNKSHTYFEGSTATQNFRILC